MNETKFAVLVIHHDSGNRYAASAFFAVEEELKKCRGATRIDSNVYLVNCQLAMPTVALLYVEQNRRDEFGRVRFSLVPCGTQIFSELREVKEKVSVSDDLSLWDMSVQAPPDAR